MPGGVNPPSGLHPFQAIAQRPDDRMIFAGAKDGETLRSVRNNAFGRIVIWARKTFGTGHGNRVDQAYARFADAIRSSHARTGAQGLAEANSVLEAARRTGKPLSSRTVNQVLSQIGPQGDGGVTSGTGLAAQSHAIYESLAEGTRRGIDAAKANVAQICNDLNTAEDCLGTLRSGDGGLRRGTTALSSLNNNLKPETLPPDSLQGTTAQWRTQSERVRGMAGQLAGACYNDALDANFMQYGNSDNPFSKVVDDLPALDRPVRLWLAEGFDLADELLQAQERAGDGLPPLGAEKLDGLQRRVDTFANSAARSISPEPEERWSAQVLRDASRGDPRWAAQILRDASRGDHGLTSGGDDSPPPPATEPAPTGGRLAANVDRVGAIAKLKQEIPLQRAEIGRLVEGGAAPEDLSRAQAEQEARELSLDEIADGRDPRDALRSRRDELAVRYGATDPRVSAYDDTVVYFSEAGGFAEVGVDTGRVPDFVDTSRILSEWRQREGDMQARGEVLRPRSGAERERAEAFEEVNAFMKQAIIDVTARRDPRPELTRHAGVLERQTFADGDTGAGEASPLRAMVKEFTLLLQASQARHDDAGDLQT